jgi:DNA-binding transcriptional LysR family regulator
MIAPRRFLPSIASLRALEALDRLGSATAVAEEMSLTQSAVSRQLQTLEAQMGVPLILREGRRMALTPPARAYVAEVREALQQIAQASLRLRVQPRGGSLDLAILPTFGMRWLVPRLADFARLHPDVTINMATRLAPFNFATQAFDAAIHYGNADWPGTENMLLRTESVVAVCTPELAARRPLRQAADLRALPLLHIETRPSAWADWFAAHGVTAEVPQGTVYDQFATITQAALHGLGIALLPDYLAEPDLAAGRLVPAFGGPTRTRGSYFLVWPRSKSQDNALGLFREWLLTQTDEDDILPR